MAFLPDNTFGGKVATQIIIDLGALWDQVRRDEVSQEQFVAQWTRLGELAFKQTNEAIKHFTDTGKQT